MRLLRVKVESFQGIELAEVEFGPGLNVLYGPNATGKSSLAHAIRSALLLPPGSSAADALQSWQRQGELPQVALTFQTEPGRVWRVSKTFASGRGSSALLEFSTDGFSFSRECSGRQVEEKVRELLRWGVRPPGGRGAPRGYPDAFLTHALLAHQEDVAQILARGIADDSDESGKKLLSEALTALAQDPLFKAVLDKATGKQSEAYTGTGRRSRSRTSPFSEINQRIQDLETELRDLMAQMGESEHAEETIRGLNREVDVLEAARAEKQEWLGSVTENLAASKAREALTQKLAAADASLAEIDQHLEAVEQEARKREQLTEQVGQSETQCTELKSAVGEAGARVESAQRALDQALNEEGAETRARKQAELETRLLQAAQRAKDAQARVQAAKAVEELQARATERATDAATLKTRLTEQQDELQQATSKERESRESLDLLESIARYGRVVRARQELAAAESQGERAQQNAQEAARERGLAEEAEQKLAQLTLPDESTLTEIKTLRQRLDVAEAALGGGLSVEVRPRPGVAFKVQVDGGEEIEHPAGEPADLQAEGALTLSVEDVLDVRITAGEQEARAEAERLRARWSEVAEPVLKAAGASTVGALEAAHRDAQELARTAAGHREKAQALEAAVGEQGAPTTTVEEARARLEQRKAALPDGLDDTLGAPFNKLGDDWEGQLEEQKKAQSTEEAAARAAREAVSGALAASKAQLEEREKQSTAAQKELAVAQKDLEQPWEQALEKAQTEHAGAEAEVQQLTQQMTALSEDMAGQEKQAREALDAARAHLKDREAALETANQRHAALREEAALADGRIKTLRERAEQLDRVSAETSVLNAKQELADSPSPAMTATEDDVANAQRALTADRTALEDKRHQLERAKGALTQVGGEVVRQQKLELEDAIKAARDREREIELEYEGWKLLMETLRDTENQEGAHLGNSLAPAVTDRFNTLTGGRYGRLELDAHLKTSGVQVAGEAREFQALSAGTRDQLATLFRLTVAEHLGSAIVLDDHLTQSDADKVDWFRDLLREMSERIQVVVLTCRPTDYLKDGEFATGEAAVNDRAGGLLKAVDLGRVVVGSGGSFKSS